jgi:hypothetical protein
MWRYQDRFGRPRAGVFAALEVRLSFAPLLTMSLPAPHIPAHPRPRRNRRQPGGQVLATRCSARRGTSTGSGQNASPARCGQGGCAAHARPQSQELSAMQQHGLPQVPTHLPRTPSATSEDGPLQEVPQPVPLSCEIGHPSPLVPFQLISPSRCSTRRQDLWAGLQLKIVANSWNGTREDLSPGDAAFPSLLVPFQLIGAINRLVQPPPRRDRVAQGK